MNFLNGYPVAATGPITVSTFVDIDTTVNFGVKQAGTGSRPIGISQAGPLQSPNLANIFSAGAVNPSPGIAATAGYQLGIFGPGDMCWLLLGTGGGCNAGAYLKPDPNGRGLATTSTNDVVAAQAFQSGNAGDLVVVYCMQWTKY